ncbi:MAG: amidase [Chloroflexi bacterium]|nr:amidase [Chloroflexota bacterium]
MDEELAFTPAWRLREMIATRDVSPVELVKLFLERIDRLNPRLHAYLTVMGELALTQAREAEKALASGPDKLGPLHGVPVSIKDLEATRGIRTTFGSLIFQEHVPEEDSIVVERVRRSGAIVMGKTNTPEFGLLGTTENRLGDACRNPWDPERTSGGSSGGAATALASGLCPLAVGSDGGGSIRIPSSFCGVYGIKPTQGRVPRYGGVGRPAANLFSQSGPMSRNVRDAALLLQVLSGYDKRDPTSLREPVPDFVGSLNQGVKGLRIAWSPDLGYAAVEPEVVDVARRACLSFQGLGCLVEETAFAVDDPFRHFWAIFSATAYASYGHLLDSHAGDMTPYGRDTLEHGAGVTGAEYSRSLRYVQVVQNQMTDMLEQYDLLMTPTMAVAAFPVGERPEAIGGRAVDPDWGFLPFTFPINMSGQTAASVPCGFTSHGMPVGLQIIARAGAEELVLRASAALEEARPWAHLRPPLH